MKIEMLKNRNGKWFWRIKAANGKILAHSETYNSKQACQKTVIAVLFHLKHIYQEVSS